MDNNLVVLKLFETWDNPRWVGEEADKYRNIVKDYSHKYFNKDLSMYSDEDRELWYSNPNPKSIPRLYLAVKHEDDRWLSELEIELAVIYGKCKDMDIVKEFICNMIEELKIKLEKVKSYVLSHQFKDGVRNTTLDYDKAQEEMYGLYENIKDLEEYLKEKVN